MRCAAILLLTGTAAFGQAFDQTLETPYGPVVVHFAQDSTRGIVANMTNHSTARIREIGVRTELVPEKGKPTMFGRAMAPVITVRDLDPGATRPALGLLVTGFRMKNSTARLTLEQLSLWADYRIEPKTQTRETAGYKLTAAVVPTGIEIEVVNKTQNPLEIVWDESSFVDYTGNAGRVMHSGVRYNERDARQPNTVIPPGAKVRDKLTPTASVRWSEHTSPSPGVWTVDSILPMEVSYDGAEDLKKTIAGAQVSGYVRLIVDGDKIGEAMKFKIVEASTSRKLDFFYPASPSRSIP